MPVAPHCPRRCAVGVLLLAWLLVAAALSRPSPLLAQQAAGPPAADRRAATLDSDVDVGQPAGRPKPAEEARQSYLGRQLAQPMSHLGASWLTRPERDQEENARRALQQMQLKPGMRVCDLGCGNGYWTLPLARAVGPQGVVYAVDIQVEMLQQLQARARQAQLTNIQRILGDVDDPQLPQDAALDLVLLVDVYHEFSHPESMLWEIHQALQPEGVIALLEYRQEDPRVPIKPLHKMSKPQIMREYTANGFKLVGEYNELPWQHLMFFARDDSPLEAIQPQPFEPQ